MKDKKIDTSIIVNEQCLLKCILLEPDNLLKIENEDYWLSPISKKIVSILNKLLDQKLELTNDNIIIEAHDEDVDLSIMSLIHNHEIVDFDYHYKQLRQNYIKDKFTTEIGKDILLKFSNRGEDLDIDGIDQVLNKAQGYLTELKDHEKGSKQLYTLKESYELYRGILEDRSKGLRSYSTGCSYLDHYINRGLVPQEMTAIFADSGIGKSTFDDYLFLKQINRQIYSVKFTPENSLELEMDRLICMKNRIPFNLLYPNKNEDHEIPLFVFDLIDSEIKALKNNPYAFICPDPIISICDLEKYIMDLKRIYKIDYLIVHLDLASMISDFNLMQDTKASNYENALNELHFLAKKSNCHFINIFQSKKNTNEHVSVKKIEDLLRFKPQLDMIKNSSSVKERHRVVLALFRMKYYALQFLPDSPETQILDDILTISIQKQNAGGLYQLEYLYDPQTCYIGKFIREEKVEEVT